MHSICNALFLSESYAFLPGPHHPPPNPPHCSCAVLRSLRYGYCVTMLTLAHELDAGSSTGRKTRSNRRVSLRLRLCWSIKPHVEKYISAAFGCGTNSCTGGKLGRHQETSHLPIHPNERTLAEKAVHRIPSSLVLPGPHDLAAPPRLARSMSNSGSKYRALTAVTRRFCC
jgi:hypothetical protein